jgi:hypothetical protein
MVCCNNGTGADCTEISAKSATMPPASLAEVAAHSAGNVRKNHDSVLLQLSYRVFFSAISLRSVDAVCIVCRGPNREPRQYGRQLRLALRSFGPVAAFQSRSALFLFPQPES